MSQLVRTTASALILRSLPTTQGDTDTGARLINGQIATALGESYDKEWSFLTAPAGHGWAASRYLTASPLTTGPIVVPPKWPKVPRGHDEIVKLFGEPCKPICERGRVTLPAPLVISWGPEKITRFACHELLVPVFTSVFNEIHRRNYWNLLEDFGGCFMCREQRGSDGKPSTHSWGIGIDINAKQNPLRAQPKMPKQIIGIFSDHGFTWGGTWTRIDGMHFQYATNY